MDLLRQTLIKRVNAQRSSSSKARGERPPLLPSKLSAALTLPLFLGCCHLFAQMIPVADLPAPDPVYSGSPEPLSHELVPALSTSSSTFATSSSLSAGGAGVQLPPPLPKAHPESRFGPFSTVALGVTGGTLGAGVELATPLARNLNLRLGGNYFNFQLPFSVDGVNYNSGIKLAATQGMIDWFPKCGAFHVSVGALYLRSTFNAAADVAPAQQFKLGGQTYLNSVDDPVQGSASLTFPRRIAPLVLLGFGNLLPRSGRHISVPFEFGGAYLQPPQVRIQLAGTACTNQGCFDTATDPSAQSNLAREQAKLNHEIRPLEVYPIVSIGLALRF